MGVERRRASTGVKRTRAIIGVDRRRSTIGLGFTYGHNFQRLLF